MAKRMIDTQLWNDENIIENFTAEDKYFWLYILTSPHNNICGVFKNSPTLIARDMGLHKDTVVNLIYRFEKQHCLIAVDKDTNEILILNWYKYNWTKSPKLKCIIEKEAVLIKSDLLRENVFKKLEELCCNDEKVDTVSIPYRYGTNTNTNSNSNTNSNIYIDNKDLVLYFDTIYNIYPRKVSKIQARITFEHKFRGLQKEEAKQKANIIYKMVVQQSKLWNEENGGAGRLIEHIPHFSTWLNDNIENSPHFKGGKK
jgi:hypothetical protein